MFRNFYPEKSNFSEKKNFIYVRLDLYRLGLGMINNITTMDLHPQLSVAKATPSLTSMSHATSSKRLNYIFHNFKNT